MILAFSQQLNGQETYFLDKIWASLLETKQVTQTQYQLFQNKHCNKFGEQWNLTVKPKPKKHTFRKDTENRWRIEKKIHFAINPRTPNYFQFVPSGIKVHSTQRYEIIWETNRYFKIATLLIDNKEKGRYLHVLFNEKIEIMGDQLMEIIQNDGFYCIEDFFKYFDTDQVGKIIHWTNTKY